jgi:polyphenol oxidase
MHTWHWQTWNDSPYLTCSVLAPWQHGFFTQHWAPRLPEALTPALDPGAIATRLRQVHGNIVLTPEESAVQRTETEMAPADGLMSTAAGQAVWVCSADCTPVLIGDAVTGQVAAIHAGWRGTAQKIVPMAIARLQSQGSKLEDLRIAMGPAISGEMYQVSETVAVDVGMSISPLNPDDRAGAIAALFQHPQSPLLEDPEPGRVRLDVRRVNAIQLEQLGISAEQIAISPHCTFQDPANFFSYRRIKEKKAQWSGIVSRIQNAKFKMD